jgi:hypothetical protein
MIFLLFVLGFCGRNTIDVDRYLSQKSVGGQSRAHSDTGNNQNSRQRLGCFFPSPKQSLLLKGACCVAFLLVHPLPEIA